MQTERKIPLQFSYLIKKKPKKHKLKKKMSIPSERGKGPILYLWEGEFIEYKPA